MSYIKIGQTHCHNVLALFIGTLLFSGVAFAKGGNTSPVAYSISGAVNGAALAGVTINLTGLTTASATTDAGGKYSFAALANGSYTITPSKTGYTFSPANSVVSVNGVNVGGTNFTATGQLNDTGSTASQCYQPGSNNLVACNSASAIALNNAQDGMTGRDANPATNNNADGKLGFSFSAVPGGCVLDNVTGLMWEVKTADGGLRDRAKTYTNYVSIKNTQQTNVAKIVAPTQAEIDAPTNSISFKNSVNAQGLCGFSDWRLPTADELQSIVDYGVAYPGITVDQTWLPNTQGNEYWSGSPYVGDTLRAWLIDFSDGRVGSNDRSIPHYVRLVHVGQ